FHQASVLMAKDDPREWETAWQDYIEPLQERYPNNPYQEQIEEFRQRINDWKSKRQAGRRPVETGPASEAHWFYLQGVRQRQQGAEEQAQQTWRNLINSFRDIPEEETWVRLSEKELSRPPRSAPSEDPRLRAVCSALDRAQRLRKEGQE